MNIDEKRLISCVFVRVNPDKAKFSSTHRVNYALMHNLGLTDLREYIASNGQLPNMPNADTVEKEGVKTGETIRLLTEKVEELTLFLIKQQEEIEALKDKLGR